MSRFGVAPPSWSVDVRQLSTERLFQFVLLAIRLLWLLMYVGFSRVHNPTLSQFVG